MGKLRNVVHFHQARGGIRPARTWLQSIMPHGWYEGAPPAQPPALDAAVAVLTAPARAV